MLLRDFIEAIDARAIFGIVFGLPLGQEAEKLTVLSYAPLLSVLALNFPKTKQAARAEFATHSENPTAQLSSAVLEQPLSGLDFETSFLAVNWQFLLNLRERHREARAPNVLVYYRFLPSLRVAVIGAQTDSLRLMKLWCPGHSDVAQRLRHFIDLDEHRGERPIYHEDFHRCLSRYYEDCCE